MIRIGDFARMAGVSVATLRLYDEQGLLKPAHVDPQSGYRTYETSQLAELHRISVLKEYGFTLREIRGVLHENLQPENLAQILVEKRRDAEAQLQIERQKIKRLELQIQIIEGLQTMTTNDVRIVTVPETTVAAIHLVIPANDQVGEILGSAYDRLFGTLGQQGVQPEGPCLAIWSSGPDDVTNEVVDVAVPIGTGLRADGDVRETILPSLQMAAVTHRGPFSEFQACHIVLKEWMASNGYRLNGPYREIYHTPPGDQSVTEVQYPVERL